jgi:diguanylate cyclase (GGDEF)-like protein
VQAARSTDLIARFGGEEFVILMPETDPQAAQQAGNRMREIIEKMDFVIDNAGKTIKRTVSIGIASLYHEGDSAEHLLKRADEALYSAKHSGRNCVKVAAQAVPKGW